MNELRTLLLGETWALPMGVGMLAVLSWAANALGPIWWPDACGPLLLAATTSLVLTSIWRTSRR